MREIVDFFGGQQDLDSGLVRVLHNHSFVDDPSRIIRAIRFEQRLHFHIEAHTLHLLKQAVYEGLLVQEDNDRILEEIRLALAEPAMPAMVDRFHRLKVLSSLFPELRYDQKVKARLKRCSQLPEALRGEDEAWQLPWLALVSRSEESFWELLGPLPCRFEQVYKVQKELSRPGLTPGQIDALLIHLPKLAGAYLWILGGVRAEERLLLYYQELKEIPSLVSGKHLIEWGLPPGPEFKVILAGLRSAQLNEEIADLEQAKAFLESNLVAD